MGLNTKHKWSFSEQLEFPQIFTYPKIPPKTTGVNLIALEIFKNNFPLGFHHLYNFDCSKNKKINHVINGKCVIVKGRINL